jgi:hypothetical protein
MGKVTAIVDRGLRGQGLNPGDLVPVPPISDLHNP